MKRLAVALLLAGCAAPPAARFALGPVGHASIQVLPARQVQAAARAWRGSDVFEYDVNLLVEQDGAFVEPEASLAATVSREGGRAEFDGLAPGRYEAHVVARGNAGGTAPDSVLNATKPAVAAFKLGETPTIPVALDDVPFEATVRFPAGAELPKWCTKVDATLSDGTRTVAITYTPAQGGRFEHVRGDAHYVLTLTAYSPKGKTTVTIPDFVIPRVDGMDTTVVPTFPTPDPPTGTLLNTYPVPGGAFAMATDPDGSHLWITNNKANTVSQLDLEGHVLATLPVGTKPSGIAVDRADGTLWVTNLNGFSVTKIVAGAVAGTYGGLFGPGGAAVDANHTAWIAIAGNGTLVGLDPTGTPVAGSPFTTGAGAAAVAVDANGAVWVVNRDDNSLSRVVNGVVTRFPIAGGPAGLGIGPTGTIWVATTNDGKLYRLNPDGSQAGVTTLITGTSAVAVDPTTGAVWIGEQAINGASKVKPDGTLVGHFGANAFPAGLAIDKNHHVWVAGNTGNNGFVSELAP
jgi:YVTN family beta-propeller protein